MGELVKSSKEVLYISSTIKPSVTRHADRSLGHVLKVNKGNQLEIHEFDIESAELKLLWNCPLNANVHSIVPIRPTTAAVDLLWLSATDFSCAIIAYDPSTQSVQTLWKDQKYQLRDSVRFHEQPTIAHPVLPVLALYVLNGFLRIARVDYSTLVNVEGGYVSGSVSVSFSEFKMDDSAISGVQFIPASTPHPLVAILTHAKQSKLQKLLRVCELNLVSQVAAEVAQLTTPLVDPYSAMLTAVPDNHVGGVIVASHKIIVYVKGKTRSQAAVLPAKPASLAEDNELILPSSERNIHGTPCAYCWLNAKQLLIGDTEGNILLVEVVSDTRGEVTGLNATLVAKSSQPASLSLLAETRSPPGHMVYVGSAFGHSELLFITSGGYKVIKTYDNLGPISDFVFVQDPDGQSNSLVTASGMNADGRLHCVRAGMVVTPLAELQQDAVRDIWALRRSDDASDSSHLLYSFIGETRVMAIGETLEEGTVEGFQLELPSVGVGNLQGDLMYQVTAGEVRFVDSYSETLLCRWTPPSNTPIVLADTDGTYLLVASANILYLLQAKPDPSHGVTIVVEDPMDTGSVPTTTTVSSERKCSVELVKSQTFESDIACLSMAITGRTRPSSSHVRYVAVGLWSSASVQILALPLLRAVTSVPMGENAIPRSVTLLENYPPPTIPKPNPLTVYQSDAPSTADSTDVPLLGLSLFTSTGSGVLTLHDLSLKETRGELQGFDVLKRAVLNIGSFAARLKPLVLQNHVLVFACCDRPCVVYFENDSVKVAPVNSSDVTNVCLFRSPGFDEETIVLGTATTIVVGTVDGIDQLHVSNIPLNMTPLRIALHKDSETAVVVCERDQTAYSSVARAVYCVSLRDPEVQSIIPNEDNMFTTAVTTCHLAIDPMTDKAFKLASKPPVPTNARHKRQRHVRNVSARSAISMRSELTDAEGDPMDTGGGVGGRTPPVLSTPPSPLMGARSITGSPRPLRRPSVSRAAGLPPAVVGRRGGINSHSRNDSLSSLAGLAAMEGESIGEATSVPMITPTTPIVPGLHVSASLEFGPFLQPSETDRTDGTLTPRSVNIQLEKGGNEVDIVRAVSRSVASAGEDDRSDITELNQLELVAIATAAAPADESHFDKPTSGMITLYKMNANEMEITLIQGACYAMKEFNGMLLAVCDFTVFLYRLVDGVLQRVHQFDCGMQCVGVDSLLNTILVLDLAQSVSLLNFSVTAPHLKLIARDSRLSWPTAAAIMEPTRMAVAVCDNLNNIYVSQAPDDGSHFLATTASFHLGETVSRVARGAISKRQESSGAVTLGTSMGSLITLGTLPPALAETAVKLQAAMEETAVNFGVFSHSPYRAAKHSIDSIGATHVEKGLFVDIDYVQQFREMSEGTQTTISAALGLELPEIRTFLSDLSLLFL